jgi:hypothetical protein
MDNIQLYIDKDKILRLEFQDAVHPTAIHPKADRWNFIYRIYSDKVLLDYGLYSSNCFICEQRRILIIEEYHDSISDKENIRVDDDIVKNLRLFDFKNGKTGKFSKLTGGSFLLQRLADNKFIFNKQYSDKTLEYEVDIASIQLIDIGKP